MTSTLQQLAGVWREAKAAEQAANALRLEIEAQIVAALPSATHEGTVRAEVEGASIKVTYKNTRRVAAPESLSQSWRNMTDAQRACFRWEPSVDVKQLRVLQTASPVEYDVLAAYIETRPTKPSVIVEPI
jgi:hypothetical protein